MYDSKKTEWIKNRILFVEKTLLSLGCSIVNMPISYKENRPIFEYNHEYYRIDRISFSGRTFIILEWAETIEKVIHNIMEDIDPFPCDLSNEEVIKEIKYALQIESYPSDYW